MLPNSKSRAALLLVSGLLAGCEPGPADRPGSSGSAAGKADDPGAGLVCARAAVTRLGDIDDDVAVELSGVVVSRDNPGVLWVHNDGGTGSRDTLLAVDARGRTLARVKLRGVDNHDWEDMALGQAPDGAGVLYLGDIGDNDGSRGHVEIVRVAEPRIDPADGPVELDVSGAETFELEYEDGEARDAEAMFVDPQTNALYVLSKATGKKHGVELFAADLPLSPGGRDTLWRVANEDDLFALDEPVVGADIARGGTRITVLLDSGRHLLFSRGPGTSVAEALSGGACTGLLDADDAEAIAFTADGRGRIVVPEGRHPDVLALSDAGGCGAWLPPIVTGHVTAKHTGELSGLVGSRRNEGVAWTHGDGDDGQPRLLAIDDDGDVLARLHLVGAENLDWEDLALLPGAEPRHDALVVGDIGDADEDRDHLTVYRVAEPDLRDLGAGTTEVAADAHALHYADGRARHAKAMLVDPSSGDLLVLAAGTGEPMTLWVAEAPWSATGSTPLRAVLDAREQEALDGEVVAADVTPDGGTVVLLFADRHAKLWRSSSGQAIASTLRGPACTIPTPRGDYEAVAIDPAGASLILVQEHDAPALWRVDAIPG